MTRARAVPLALIGALMTGLLAAGCAIPTQKVPSAISPSHVPFGLLNPNLPTTTTTQPRLSTQVPVKIYLLGAHRKLEPVARVVLIPAPLKSVIISLLAGPSRSESANGLTTALPSNVSLVATPTVAKNPSLVTVDFNAAFGQITHDDIELAVAQVVDTVVTQVGPGTGVSFEIEGEPVNVPIATGVQVPGPVYLPQFAANQS